jgi:hypothetical protein
MHLMASPAKPVGDRLKLRPAIGAAPQLVRQLDRNQHGRDRQRLAHGFERLAVPSADLEIGPDAVSAKNPDKLV